MAKFLLADDSSFMRKILSDILMKNGHGDIVEASNGQEAIEKFETEKPDVVLLDIIMPQVDGTAVLEKIVPAGAKAIIISAVGQDEIIEKAKNLGASGYVLKPFDESKVMEEVNKILG